MLRKIKNRLRPVKTLPVLAAFKRKKDVIMGIIGFIIWIVIGAIIGAVAGKIMNEGRKGFWRNAILGIVGSTIGSFAGGLIHARGSLMGFVLSVAGACLVIWIGRQISNKK